MKVTLLNTQGYCAGVKYAIDLAYKAKKEHPNEDVYVLGMLVHNQNVIDELTNNGIITLDRRFKSDETLLYELKDGSTIIFSAHGHIPKLDQIALEKQFKVYDATCPKVLKNLRIIDEEINQNHQVIYIGHKNHPEALAALARSNNVYFYDIEGEFNYKLIKDKSPLVINQTTLNVEELKKIYMDIIINKPKARILDEICNTTRLRQMELKDIPNDTDLILIIGDYKSSNTNRLLEISKLYHPNIDSYLIDNLEQLKKLPLGNYSSVVIASGASTPKSIIDNIYGFLKNI